MIMIRKAERQDAPQMWELMRELAVFENYIDSFAITPEIVESSGFDKEPVDFYSFVAVDGERVVGLAVYYFLPYTAQNRPAIYLKELYISPDYRGQQIGDRLMQALKEEAKVHNCQQIKWTVAPWNKAGQAFYQKLGARENSDWLNYEWELDEK